MNEIIILATLCISIMSMVISIIVLFAVMHIEDSIRDDHKRLEIALYGGWQENFSRKKPIFTELFDLIKSIKKP